MLTVSDSLVVREAQPEDLLPLACLKAPEAIHYDRLQEAAASPGFKYLVLVKENAVIGFACLVFVRPLGWSDAEDRTHLPQIVDLLVSPDLRRRGYGSFFIGELEARAKAHGSSRLYIAVDFPANVGAHALYLRLGYRQLQLAPYPKHWQFTDSRGGFHEGNDLIVDMVKML